MCKLARQAIAESVSDNYAYKFHTKPSNNAVLLSSFWRIMPI